MPQAIFRNDRMGFSHPKQQIMVMLIHWTIGAIMMLHQMKATDALKYKGDNCISKKQPGICKEWSECPIIKTLIDNGEYTNREVVSCGFGIKEELICCPVQKNDPTIETSTVENKNGFPESPTTTQVPVRDFWMDLLENTTSSTAATPDFWLDLLKPTTPMATTTTTTTTIKPLIVGDQRLNESSQFFDFNALLVANQNGGSKQALQPISERSVPNQGFITPNDNGRGNLNTGPINLNQWSFHQTGNNFNNGPDSANFNNGRGHGGPNNFRENGNGNRGWGQQNNGRGQENFNRGHNMGRGPHNNNNGRGPHNNGRVRNNFGMANQNQGFNFPETNMRPNNLFDDAGNQNRRPGRPVNNMQEQNPNTHFPSSNAPNFNNNNNEKPNNNEQNRLEDLINTVFKTSTTEIPAVVNHEDVTEIALEDTIANVFNVNKPQNIPAEQTEHSQPVMWVTIPENNNKNNNPDIYYGELHRPHHQMELINPQAPGQFEIIPAEGNQLIGNDLDVAPSTSFIQQPVVIQNWSSNPPAHRPDFNPVQIVYENLANSGMDIVQAKDSRQMGNVFNQQPAQVVVVQPQPQFNHQQPFFPQNFGHPSQQFAQHPQPLVSSGKETRSTSPHQQFVPQTHSESIPNVQSPPTKILDPFKPFEFRPPPEDEHTFSEDNNSLSTNPTPTKPHPKPSTDRPAIRACRRIEKGLTASLSPHILGGVPAELGEFPHMVAIGYSRIGRPGYDIRCGGTLIDKRYVLTAAHCVSERGNVPSIVRLGVVNFTDTIQMSAAIELSIKETYIHDDYLTRLTYNDIAVLELERDVEYSEYVYPVCLYTDETDPDTKIKLWVTGWGTVNTTTRTFSDILLKAPLHTSPLINCNASFTDYGLNRRIPEGIVRSQFCAEDKDQIKDACQGDSGGPLNMVIDESYKKYRLVGIVSSGFGCASSTPGLYTRVAAFLDFIEKVVWPNGGD